MFPALQTFFEDIEKDSIKFVRPRKFVFLCGGVLDPSSSQYISVRDFFIKRKVLEGISVDYVLAESANKLYENTKYKDLISFEEDVAKIAAIILVITESPGSLAELGAFASYEPLKSNLRLIVDAKHETDKSFIRDGPIRRLQQRNTSRVGFFDWHHGTDGYLLPEVVKHEVDMSSFIFLHVKSVSASQSWADHKDLAPFSLLLWIIYVAQVISFELLLRCAKSIDENLQKNDIINKLYCLQLAKWIVRKTYSNKVYFYTTFDIDPLKYAYRTGAKDNDSARRKSIIGIEIEAAEKIPETVRDEAFAARQP